MVKFVNTCVERDKKNLKKKDFCLQLYAEMIDFAPLRRRGGYLCSAQGLLRRSGTEWAYLRPKLLLLPEAPWGGQARRGNLKLVCRRHIGKIVSPSKARGKLTLRRQQQQQW